MTMTKIRTLAAVIFAAGLATAAGAYAWEDSATAPAAPAIPMTKAIETAEQQANGRAIEAELERSVHGPYYEVKVAGKDGVYKIYVDANDGKVLATKQKNRLTSWLDDNDNDDD